MPSGVDTLQGKLANESLRVCKFGCFVLSIPFGVDEMKSQIRNFQVGALVDGRAVKAFFGELYSPIGYHVRS